MLVEKEIIGPGTYWYVDQKTGVPHKFVVTPQLTKHWHEMGSKMLSAGLPVPVPYEHDFDQHPMTPKEQLLNNAGEVKEYRLKGDTLFGVVNIQDDAVKGKIGKSVRWTSPWINSFTDGDGRQWDNVITHLALTSRPRITKQAPFPSIAAALSLATPVDNSSSLPQGGLCLSRAGRLVRNKRTNELRPLYPIAFSILGGGIAFGEGDDTKPLKKKEKSDSSSSSDKKDKSSSDKSDSGPPSKSKTSSSSKPPSKDDNPTPTEEYDGGEADDGSGDDVESFISDNDSDDSFGGGSKGPMGGKDLNPMGDMYGDVRMEELLCDLLNALGVFMPENVGEAQFKRALYEAVMGKIRELTSQAQMGATAGLPTNQPPAPKPQGTGAGQGQSNPLIQQEQQPMYMSLEEINKLPEPMKGVALAMHAENVKLRTELDANKKTTESLRDAKLKEATASRDTRIALLGKRAPSTKADLDALKALPAMALSMGDNGEVVDPMAQTLSVLEKGLQDMPLLLMTPAAALSLQAQPADAEMTQQQADELADSFARSMGAPPEQKKAS